MNLRISEIKSTSDPVIDEAIRLLNRTQGDGLYDRTYLEEKITSKNAYFIVAHEGEKLVSAGGAILLENFDFYKPFDANIDVRMAGKRVGCLNTLSVVETHQGKGIGQQMGRIRLNWLKSQGCDTVVGISWVSGLENTSDRVFEKLGFRRVSFVPEFFRHAMSYISFSCPGCHNQPCLCSAVLYELDL